MPTWASAPISSSARISSGVVTPPAMVTRQSAPAASTTALASSRLVPPMRPSSSTKVTRKPAHGPAARRSARGCRGRCPAASPRPRPRHAARRAPRSPARAAAATGSRAWRRCPGSPCAHPCRASRWRVATSRMPPPTRQAKRASSGSIRAALLPVRMAASRSMTAISPAIAKRSAMGIGIAGVDGLLGTADELDGLAALQVDAGDDHGRTRMPCSCR